MQSTSSANNATNRHLHCKSDQFRIPNSIISRLHRHYCHIRMRLDKQFNVILYIETRTYNRCRKTPQQSHYYVSILALSIMHSNPDMFKRHHFVGTALHLPNGFLCCLQIMMVRTIDSLWPQDRGRKYIPHTLESFLKCFTYPISSKRFQCFRNNTTRVETFNWKKKKKHKC